MQQGANNNPNGLYPGPPNGKRIDPDDFIPFNRELELPNCRELLERKIR